MIVNPIGIHGAPGLNKVVSIPQCGQAVVLASRVALARVNAFDEAFRSAYPISL